MQYISPIAKDNDIVNKKYVDNIVSEINTEIEKTNESLESVETQIGNPENLETEDKSSLVNAINDLKKAGYWIIGLELDGSIDYRKQDYLGKIAVVIGSEGKGISRLVKENCDFKVFIPMVGHVNSLNASVSASILFYEILRNRG